VDLRKSVTYPPRRLPADLVADTNGRPAVVECAAD
jgi:hypothetical protein